MRNYIPKALECLQQRVPASADNDHVVKYKLVLAALKGAVPWNIEDLHNMWDIDLTTTDYSDLSPPYDLMAIEYNFPADLLTKELKSNSELADRRIVLIINDVTHDEFRIIPFWYSHVLRDWAMSPVYIMVNREAMKRTSEWLHPGGVGRKDQEVGPTFNGTFATLEELLSEGVNPADLASSVVDDLRLTLALMSMLTCSNIEVRETKPPKMINKKRAKKGKPLLPAYHSVVIHHTKAAIRAHRQAKEERRTSPKPHWRRAHRRTYATGKHKWIRAMRIGGAEADLPEYEIL